MAKDHSLRDRVSKLFKKEDKIKDILFAMRPERRAMLGFTTSSASDEFHGVKVTDPFRMLEDLDKPWTQNWVAKQNRLFESAIADQAGKVAEVSAFMTKALDYDSYGVTSRYGDKYFRVFHKALAAQPRLEVSDSENGPWNTLLDPNALSETGIVSLSDWSISKDGKRIVYLTSTAGSDDQTLKIRDIATGEDLSDVIVNCRFTEILWDKDSHDSFYYTYPAHDDNHRILVKHHKIGDDIANDKVIYERPEAESFLSPARLKTAKYEWMYTAIGTDNRAGLAFRPFGSTEAFKTLVEPQTYNIQPVFEFEDGSIIAITDKDASRSRIVKFDPNKPAEENWQVLVAEHESDVLQDVMIHKGKLFAFYSKDTADAVRVFTPEGEYLHDMPLPIQSTASYARINDNDDVFHMEIAGFQSEGDFYTYNIEKNELTKTADGPAPGNLNDCIVERIHATSKDGTKVPMTVIRHPDTKLDGTAAVKLYGYGGFDISLTPEYDSEIMHFVKSGGIYVQANLRGGGEYGQEWYDQGRLLNKQNVFDDFIACAEHLIAEKYTSSKRLVINGASNGGLLTAATMLQRPDLFGAVVTEVPVTDLFRFHLATYGASWKSDYGDISVKEDFNAAARYSPLHNVKPDAKYPPHLIKTSDHDDRVSPWHSYKLVAALQTIAHRDNVTLLRVETDAGHGAGLPTEKRVKGYAETHAFIEKSIGPINQNDYVAKLATAAEAAKLAREAQKAAAKAARKEKFKNFFKFKK